MADQTNVTTEILKFEIETGDAISEQEKLKDALVSLGEEKKKLNKALKDEVITQKEYSQEIVRVENNQKKLAASYSDIQKKVTGLKSPMQELTKSNQNLAAAFQNLGANVNVGGVSITNVTGKLAQFATPAGIAVGLVGALSAAYASSASGAKDMEFAQNQLSFALQNASNSLGELVGSKKDGEGLLAKFVNFGLKFSGVGLVDKLFGSGIIENSKQAALGVEKLQDAERELLKIRAVANDRLQDNADKLTEINDSQTSYNRKVQLFAEIQENLKKNREDQVGNLNEQIEILKAQEPFVKDQEGLQEKILQKELERSSTEKAINRFMESTNRLASNTADAAEKEAAARQKLLDNLSGNTKGFAVTESSGQDDEIAQMQAQVDAVTEGEQKKTDAAQAYLDAYGNIIEQKGELDNFSIDDYKKKADEQTEIDRLTASTKLHILQNVTNAAGQIFGKQSLAYRAIASSQALVQSFLAAQESYASVAGIPYVGPILGAVAYAAALANGLATVASINRVKFAGGGRIKGPGTATSDSVPISASNGEYIVNAQATAQHLPLLESINRGRFAQGGQVSNINTNRMDQIMMTDIFKNLPKIELSLKELSLQQNRVAIKEQLTQV